MIARFLGGGHGIAQITLGLVVLPSVLGCGPQALQHATNFLVQPQPAGEREAFQEPGLTPRRVALLVGDLPR